MIRKQNILDENSKEDACPSFESKLVKETWKIKLHKNHPFCNFKHWSLTIYKPIFGQHKCLEKLMNTISRRVVIYKTLGSRNWPWEEEKPRVTYLFLHLRKFIINSHFFSFHQSLHCIGGRTLFPQLFFLNSSLKKELFRKLLQITRSASLKPVLDTYRRK